MDIKKQVFKELDGLCKPEAILASNTSGLSITEMASVTARPHKVIGMHFFNPVPVMKLVEIIRGFVTDDATFDATKALVERIGKTPVEVKEAPGFAVNRHPVPHDQRGDLCLRGRHRVRRGHRPGHDPGSQPPHRPLALADMVGLDTLLFVLEGLHKELGEDKYRPRPCFARWFGPATWAGRAARASTTMANDNLNDFTTWVGAGSVPAR